jgi:predicted nicotinamide N-methyase
VLELGSGCGIIGKALASIRPNCHVILSDLPDAMDLMEHNITDSHLALGSQLSSLVLDWDRDLPGSITAEQFDLVLVCDCTYNTDSIPALVKTLSALVAQSPAVMIVVANKIRHESELSFFDQMADVGLVEDEQLTIPVDHGSLVTDSAPQNIDIHVYVNGEARRPSILEHS